MPYERSQSPHNFGFCDWYAHTEFKNNAFYRIFGKQSFMEFTQKRRILVIGEGEVRCGKEDEEGDLRII